MQDFTIYIIALFAGAIIAAFTGIWFVGLTPENLPVRQRLPRNKQFGAVLAFLGLLWCIPQALPIVWDWMQPWLLPMAIAFTGIAYFCLDYLFARAAGGLLILQAYYFLHTSFTFHAPGAPFFAILCWILGIAGLFFAAKPHLLRDLIRWTAASRRVKLILTGFLAVFAGYCLFAGVMHVISK